MNIFIKFYILSVLIDLNSAIFVNIIIDKIGLKSEPKNFASKDYQFLVKLAKWSSNVHQWEYAIKSEFTQHNYVVALKLPEEWANLFEFENKRYRFKKIKPRKEPFWLAVKVEMVDNKLIEPIPFILHKENPLVKFILKEDERGKIVGKINEESLGQSNWAIEEYLNKIEMEKNPSSQKNNIQQRRPNSFTIDFSKGLSTQKSQNVQKLPSQNILPPNFQNPTKFSSADLLKQWHKTNQQLQAKQMAINQMKNANYFNNAGNIQQIASINAEMPQNAQRHGKEIMAETGGDEPESENWPQFGPKLMQSAISASQRLIIPWYGRKQHLGQNIQNHGKDPEIGGDDNRPRKQQKLIHPTNNSVNLSHQIPLYWKENEAHSYSKTAAGQIMNKGIHLNTDETGGKQHEFGQINQNEFSHGIIPSINAGKPIGEWHQNLPIQQTNIGESMGEKKDEFFKFTSNGFTQQHQGNIPPIDETETEDPMEFWHKILHDLSPKPAESMTGRQHEFTQIYPNTNSHSDKSD